MEVRCSSCHKKYSIKDEKIPIKITKKKCPNCHNTIVIPGSKIHQKTSLKSFTKKNNHNVYFQNVICLLPIFVILLSFKFVDNLIRYFGMANIGLYVVVLYWLLFTYLIYKQTKELKKRIRDVLVGKIFNKEFWLAKLLNKGTTIPLIAFAVSIPISLMLLTFVFISGIEIILLLFFSTFIFAWINNYFDINLEKNFELENAFQKDIADLISRFAPIFINIAVLSTIFIFLSMLDSSNVYSLGSKEIPLATNKNINHSCYYFQSFARTIYLMDLNLKSLKKIEEFGSYIYAIILLATTSVVPFTGISFIYQFILIKRKEFDENGKGYRVFMRKPSNITRKKQNIADNQLDINM